MAENLRSKLDAKDVPSNEEIIDEIMKGVEDCLIETDEVHEDKDDSACSITDDTFNASDTGEVQNKQKSEKCDEVVSDKVIAEDDFIDESFLEEIEKNLSEAEKEKRRLEAESHKLKGNELFKSGAYKESIENYTLGLKICPLAYPKERSILYSNRAAAKMKLNVTESAIEDCTKAVTLDPVYLKARFRRAQLYEETDKLDEALADYQEILKLDPLHQESLYASKRLPEKINERNEKMKTEMLGKLKDLGNMILRPFNLSTDNFQVNQDPNTGGYSINFKANA